MAFSAKEAHRAATFQKKRQKEQEDLQLKKKKIEEELQVGSISNKFAAHYDAIEQQLKSDTIGILHFMLVITFLITWFSFYSADLQLQLFSLLREWLLLSNALLNDVSKCIFVICCQFI